MKRSLLLSVGVLLLTVPAFSQHLIRGQSISEGQIGQSTIRAQLNNFSVYTLDLFALNRIVKDQPNGTEVQLVLGEETLNLTIIPHQIKATNYLRAENGGTVVQSNSEDCITYSGFVNDNSTHDLRLTITENKIKGYITTDHGRLYLDQLSKFDVTDARLNSAIVVFRPEDIRDIGAYCGVATLKEDKALRDKIDQRLNNNALQWQTCGLLELATEADYQFYQRYGSGSNSEILAIVNMVEGLYANTFDLQIRVVYQHVWTISSDPFTGDPTTPAGADLMLTELKDYWEANMQSVHRDLVHMFTGRGYNLGGVAGVAYLSTVCVSPEESYGFTRDRIDQFTTTAHEIGHNFGGEHSDGQNCNTSNASVMCQGLKAVPMYFSSASTTKIGNFISANSACLQPFANVMITGSSVTICTSGTFNANNVPPWASLSWSASPSGIVNLSPSGNSVTLTKVGNGIVTLTATLSYGCISEPITKKVYVGLPNYLLPEVYVDPFQTSTVCAGTPVPFVAYYDRPDPVDGTFWKVGVTELQWSVSPAPASIIYNSGIEGITKGGAEITFATSGTHYITVRVKNACGWSSTGVQRSVYVNPATAPPCQGLLSFSVVPNPVQNTINVKFNNKEEAVQGITTATLYDMNYNVVREMRLSTVEDFSLDASSLTMGVYILHVQNGGFIEKQSIIVHQ